MTIFGSLQPPIKVPQHLPLWTWLFDSEYSPLSKPESEDIQGFTNAISKEHLSFKALKTCTEYLSTALVKNFGLRPGEVVTLFSPNTVWYPCALFGILRAGGIVSGASPAYSVEEITYALKAANTEMIFTVPNSAHVAITAARNVGIPAERVFLLEGKLEGLTTISELLELGKSYGSPGQVEPFRLPAGKQNKDVCGFLSFSSGTTGLPKAVMISHSNVIAQCLQMQQVTPDTLRGVLAVLPFFHITGLVHHLHLPILLNANVYMLPSFSMDTMLAAIQEYKIEEVLLVPPIIIRLVRDQGILSKYDLSCVRRFASGAAPLSAEILDLLRQRFAGAGFKQGYGMTESCSCITIHPPEKYDFKYASRVGTIVASTEVKIVNSGKNCGLNEPGEIWCRGPQVAMGYLNNKRATEETFDQDGFLHTGDIGFIDEEGLITITDRLKELIKVKGIGVAPAELEDSLLGHEDVEDVAVLGIADDYSGERPKAFVVPKVLKKRSDLEKLGQDLIQFVEAKKVRHKWIQEVEFVDEIPKSASGKILRRILRDRPKKISQNVIVTREEAKRPKL